ncbi:MAG: hypothetical protein V3T88_08385 [Nitrosomonadaceae bacterium]
MSKIQLMGSGAYDISCPVKRVFFRPSTAADTIRVGDQVCYNSDSVQDHKERTADPSHLGLTQDTFAEGEQEFTGRLFIVEKPATANLHAYAGVVKSLGEKIGGDGDMIEIFIPTEGAIVPVISDQNCTLDRTIMGIRNNAYEASYPGRPIGVAIETVNRDTTDGLVWMRFKNFDYGGINGASDATANSLIVDDEATSNNIVIDFRNYRFDGTGRARALYYIGEINGLGHSTWGMFKFRTYVSAALVANVVHVITANLHFKDAATIAVTSGHWNSALYATVETEVTTTAPDLSGGSVAGLSLEYYVDETTGAPANAFCLYVHTDAAKGQWDGLLAIRNAGDCGDYSSTGNAPALATGDKMIPVYIAGSTYYLVALVDSGV